MNVNSLNRRLILLLIACSTASFLGFTTPVTDWLRQHIDQRLSVEFPINPKQSSGGGTTLYFAKAPEASYMASAIHYNNQPHLKPITNPYHYYVSMLHSQIRESNGTLVDSSSFTLDNYKGLQFSIISLHPNGRNQITRTKRVIFVEGRVYQAAHLPLAPVTKTSQEKMRKFFDSMRLTHL